MSKIVEFFLENISIKFDAHKLKKFVDLGFVLFEKIIAKLSKLFVFYLDFYDDMIENEIILASISKNDEILHIGCGSFPATSLLLAKKTKAEVTGIDNKKSSVKQALKIVKNQIFSEKIQIVHADALSFPLNTYDVIIISQGVEPYAKILKNISKNLKKNGRVIFRTSSTSEGNLKENDMFLNDFFKVDDIISQKKNGLLISALLYPLSK